MTQEIWIRSGDIAALGRYKALEVFKELSVLICVDSLQPARDENGVRAGA